ncbi:hypothetical protein BH11VER1_BH11VER1_31920 [soil metagenome]
MALPATGNGTMSSDSGLVFLEMLSQIPKHHRKIDLAKPLQTICDKFSERLKEEPVILAQKNSNAHLASTWALGVALATLGIGLYGATQPLLPPTGNIVGVQDIGDSVFIEEFDPPPAAASEVELPPETEPEIVEELEVPAVPVIEAPLHPPEMAELTPLEPLREDPPAKVETQKPAPISKPKSVAQKSSASKTGKEGEIGSDSSGAPSLFSGTGKSGKFPSPSYPASARSNGLQGVVRLLVVVESSGLPGSVSVETSSGHTSLDLAASDHIRRRWRWPAGEVRRYIVPVRFVLQ